jgi:dCTP deaminase
MANILDMRKGNTTYELEIPEEGLILWPGILYLGRTIECIGSNKFVPIVEGRSSVGRLGIHVHVTAGFCDVGFKGTITLEIHVIHPVRVYPNIPICQAYFLKPEGKIELYKGRYQNQEDPTPSRFQMPKEQSNKNVYADLPDPGSDDWDEELHNPPMGGPPISDD